MLISDEKKIIDKACELIETGWIKHTYARNKNWYEVSCYSNKAVYFCLEGALFRAVYELFDKEIAWYFSSSLFYIRLEKFIINNTTKDKTIYTLFDFNDDICNDKNEVIDMLRQFKETLI